MSQRGRYQALPTSSSAASELSTFGHVPPGEATKRAIADTVRSVCAMCCTGTVFVVASCLLTIYATHTEWKGTDFHSYVQYLLVPVLVIIFAAVAFTMIVMHSKPTKTGLAAATKISQGATDVATTVASLTASGTGGLASGLASGLAAAAAGRSQPSRPYDEEEPPVQEHAPAPAPAFVETGDDAKRVIETAKNKSRLHLSPRSYHVVGLKKENLKRHASEEAGPSHLHHNHLLSDASSAQSESKRLITVPEDASSASSVASIDDNKTLRAPSPSSE